jgi:hypothetical protein
MYTKNEKNHRDAGLLNMADMASLLGINTRHFTKMVKKARVIGPDVTYGKRLYYRDVPGIVDIVRGSIKKKWQRRPKHVHEAVRKMYLGGLRVMEIVRWTGLKQPAVTDVLIKHGLQKKQVRYEYGGRSMTLCAWAKERGLNYMTLRNRVLDWKWPLAEALGFEPHKKGGGQKRVNVTYGGRTMTMKEWAVERGICYATLQCRIRKYKWPVAEALEFVPHVHGSKAK